MYRDAISERLIIHKSKSETHKDSTKAVVAWRQSFVFFNNARIVVKFPRCQNLISLCSWHWLGAYISASTYLKYPLLRKCMHKLRQILWQHVDIQQLMSLYWWRSAVYRSKKYGSTYWNRFYVWDCSTMSHKLFMNSNSNTFHLWTQIYFFIKK